MYKLASKSKQQQATALQGPHLHRTWIHLTLAFPLSSLESPIYGLDDIYNNKVVTIRYRDPKYPDGFIFEAKPLPGAIEPPNVLAPEQRPSNYRPQIGFNRDFPQASLGQAGHRMVNHHSGGYKQHRQQQQQQHQQNYSSDNRNFASIPPPNNYRHSEFIQNLCSPLNCIV